MSYLTISEEHMNEPVKKVRDHSGQRNPHYNCPHSPESKEAISQTQKARYDLLRAAVEKAKNPLTEERVKEIVRETVADYIKNNTNKSIDIRL